jgi:hypothetical protein
MWARTSAGLMQSRPNELGHRERHEMEFPQTQGCLKNAFGMVAILFAIAMLIGLSVYGFTASRP